jgi:EAL domain-containing protein (putative c-di-GMP-specific phosphodiesterase class I)/CheY-like chemotaxis protein
MPTDGSHPTREIKVVDEHSRNGTPRLLLVEDDDSLRTVLARKLVHGFELTGVADGPSAADLLVRRTFDVVLSDIGLPGMSGIDLLRLVRSYDLDVPVVLMTGEPSVETAAAAVDLGALMYITKPFEIETLYAALRRAATLAGIARAKRAAIAAGLGGSPLAGDLAGLEACFQRALDGLWIAFQPIVETRSKRTVAYEALMRTSEPTIADPGRLLEAAERLDRMHDLGRRVRQRAVATFDPPEREALLFVNLHANDLTDPDLYDPGTPFSQMASRVVLEVTERAALDSLHDARRRTAILRQRGFQLAIDDLGAGYAGLTSFAMLEPDIAKLDMSLIRGIDGSPVRCRIVETITKLCRELNMRVVAEGIETSAELGRVLEFGCDYLQGYLFGRPARDALPSPHAW